MMFGLLKSKEKKLLDVAYHGNINKLKTLLNKGVDIEYTNAQGVNALKCAVGQNHEKRRFQPRGVAKIKKGAQDSNEKRPFPKKRGAGLETLPYTTPLRDFSDLRQVHP